MSSYSWPIPTKAIGLSIAEDMLRAAPPLASTSNLVRTTASISTA